MDGEPVEDEVWISFLEFVYVDEGHDVDWVGTVCVLVYSLEVFVDGDCRWDCAVEVCFLVLYLCGGWIEYLVEGESDGSDELFPVESVSLCGCFHIIIGMGIVKYYITESC